MPKLESFKCTYDNVLARKCTRIGDTILNTGPQRNLVAKPNSDIREQSNTLKLLRFFFYRLEQIKNLKNTFQVFLALWSFRQDRLQQRLVMEKTKNGSVQKMNQTESVSIRMVNTLLFER
jgi:hypothetical protein